MLTAEVRYKSESANDEAGHAFRDPRHLPFGDDCRQPHRDTYLTRRILLARVGHVAHKGQHLEGAASSQRGRQDSTRAHTHSLMLHGVKPAPGYAHVMRPHTRKHNVFLMNVFKDEGASISFHFAGLRDLEQRLGGTNAASVGDDTLSILVAVITRQITS